ncbi:MAG: dihydroorotase, partial [Novosphingobium sp.]
MIPRPLTITGGKLVLPEDSGSGAPKLGALRCEEGRIVALGNIGPEDGDEVIDARGALITPGLVDFGVFAIDKPAFHFGGITRAALMPDQGPPLDHPARVRFAAQSGKPDMWVHPLAAATRGLEGKELGEVGLMRRAGARGIATGRTRIADAGVMLRLLSYAGGLDMVTVAHAEDEGLTRNAVATEGEMAMRLGLPAAPAAAEAIAVARDLALVEVSGARLHFRQLTTAAAFDLIRAAKAKGLPVTCGISPAHLFLSDGALGSWRTFTRLSPPLRSEDDRHAARAALADGTIDVLASAHDPRGPEDKRLPFADAAPGMAGAETLL